MIAEYSATRDAAGALIPFTETSRTSDGVTLGTTAHCWGAGAPGNACATQALGEACTSPTGDAAQIENACYLDPVKPTQSVTSWRVTHGTLDVENRDSKFFQQAALTPVTITDKYRFRFPTMSIEHMFKAGSQIAVIVGGYNTSRGPEHRPAEQRAGHARYACEQGDAAGPRRQLGARSGRGASGLRRRP